MGFILRVGIGFIMDEQLNIFKQNLTDGEFSVWQIIERHKGRDNAVSVNQVAWQARMNEKGVREIVSELVRKHGKLIGSSTGNPPGFYIIEDIKELESHIRSLRHRGISILYRAAQLSRTSITDIFKQTILEFEEKERRMG